MKGCTPSKPYDRINTTSISTYDEFSDRFFGIPIPPVVVTKPSTNSNSTKNNKKNSSSNSNPNSSKNNSSKNKDEIISNEKKSFDNSNVNKNNSNKSNNQLKDNVIVTSATPISTVEFGDFPPLNINTPNTPTIRLNNLRFDMTNDNTSPKKRSKNESEI